MGLIWKNIIIDGIETGWKISNNGTIQRRNGSITKGYTNPYGYLRVKINYRHYLVHRLVAEYFIENSENKPEVDHINAKRDDNRVENLRWCTRKENMNNIEFIKKMKDKGSPNTGKKHSLETRAKMSAIKQMNNTKAIKVQCVETGEIFNSYKSAQKEYNLSNFLHKVVDKPNLTAGGYHWVKYQEVAKCLL